MPGVVMPSTKPMPGEQLELRLAGLLETALGKHGPGLDYATRVIADVLVDCACCAPGRSGATLVNGMITRMRSRLDQHGLSSST